MGGGLPLGSMQQRTKKTKIMKRTSLITGLYPSTFADPHFRNEDSVFVTHECSSGGEEGKSLKGFVISAS